MVLPIGLYGLLVGGFAIIAIASGIWLVLRSRDVARLADTSASDVVPGRRRRPGASKQAVRLMLAITIFSTIGALGIFALVATGVIDSQATRTDTHAQRP